MSRRRGRAHNGAPQNLNPQDVVEESSRRFRDLLPVLLRGVPEVTSIVTPPDGEPYPACFPGMRGHEDDSGFQREAAVLFPFAAESAMGLKNSISSGRKVIIVMTSRNDSSGVVVIRKDKFEELVTSLGIHHDVTYNNAGNVPKREGGNRRDRKRDGRRVATAEAK